MSLALLKINAIFKSIFAISISEVIRDLAPTNVSHMKCGSFGQLLEINTS
jgi:hypothetical protein